MPASPVTELTPCRILLVEDDHRLSALIQDYLQQQGFVAAIEARGDTAVARIRSESPDLVVLDLMLPGLDGLAVCKAVRPDYSGPILMLTASDDDINQVVGLELGADDYVTKPIQPRVLLARMRALLRRFGAGDLPTPERGPLCFGTLRISAASREVWLGDQELELTTNEFDLLWLLASHAGQVLTREVILEKLRGIDYDGLDRSVDIRVSRLRKKLRDDTSRPFRIKTVRGQGYLLVQDAWG